MTAWLPTCRSLRVSTSRSMSDRFLSTRKVINKWPRAFIGTPTEFGKMAKPEELCVWVCMCVCVLGNEGMVHVWVCESVCVDEKESNVCEWERACLWENVCVNVFASEYIFVLFPGHLGYLFVFLMVTMESLGLCVEGCCATYYSQHDIIHNASQLHLKYLN